MEHPEDVVLVTGGCGFLGLNLLEHLAKNRLASTCIVVDNGITCSLQDARIKIQKLQHKYPLTDFHVYTMDICSKELVVLLRARYKHINKIYHFASLASPIFYKQFPLETLDVGYIGTKNMLELCTQYTDCRFLLSSTSEVYGDPTVHPQHESYHGNVNCYGERSCYDTSKRIAETLVYTYRKLYNLDTRIVRIFNTYGPHMNLHDGRIITEIAKALLLKTPLCIFGNGNQTRSLNYVDDTIQSIVDVMHSDYHQPINVGNDNEISINQLVIEFQQVYRNHFDRSSCLDINYTSIDPDDPKIRKPCLKLHKRILGENPVTSLDIGLYRTLQYFSQQV